MRLFRTLFLAGSAALVTFAVVSASAQQGTPKPAQVRIPKEFKYAGQVHAKGSYGVRVEPGTEGPYVVVLGKDGTELIRELAIVQPEKGKVSGVRTAVHLMTRDEHMVRIVIRQDDKRYLAYFETTS